MNEIQKWLTSDSKDYTAGVQLLAKHTSNRVLINQLMKKENSWNKDKLTYELSKLVDNPEVENNEFDEIDLDETGENEEKTSTDPLTTSQTDQDCKVVKIAIVGGDYAQVIAKLAQAFGKSLEEISAMVADVQKGDFERVKEIGLKIEHLADSKLHVTANGQSSSFEISDMVGLQIMAYLLEILTNIKIAQAIKVSPQPVLPVVDLKEESPKIPAQPDLTTVEGLTIAMSDLYTEKARLSNTLADFGDSNEETTRAQRQSVVDHILLIEEKYNTLAGLKKHIEQNGSLPEIQVVGPQVQTMDKSELIQKRNNLRSNVTKAKNKLKESPENVQAQEKLAKLEAELEEIENRLKLS